MKFKLLLNVAVILYLCGLSSCKDVEDQSPESKPKWQVFTTKNGLPSDTILSLAQDCDGAIWIGTQNGLCKLASSTSSDFELKKSDLRVNSINCCSNGYVMLSTSRGAYVIYNNLWYYVNDERRNCIDMEYFEETIWCLYDDGVIYVNQDSISKKSGANDIYINGSSLWLCRLGGLFRYLPTSETYNSADGMSSNSCFTMYQDENNVIWAGTFDEYGLTRISSSEVKNFKCGYISSIAEDHDGNMWFGSQYYGVYKLDKDGNIVNYTTLDGLPKNKVTDLLVTTDGTLWVSTKGGGIAKLENL